jgi:hypothetical protein
MTSPLYTRTKRRKEKQYVREVGKMIPNREDMKNKRNRKENKNEHKNEDKTGNKRLALAL